MTQITLEYEIYVYLFDSVCLLYVALYTARCKNAWWKQRNKGTEKERNGEEQVKSVISTLMLLLFSYICSREFEYRAGIFVICKRNMTRRRNGIEINGLTTKVIGSSMYGAFRIECIRENRSCCCCCLFFCSICFPSAVFFLHFVQFKREYAPIKRQIKAKRRKKVFELPRMMHCFQ